MPVLPYDRTAAVNYALRWALSRNPEYTDFSNLGGDCTNFVSQCVFAGSGVMNFSPIFGWYYLSSYDRAPAWTGVEFFRNFLINNTGVGPFGSEVPVSEIKPGDIVQFMSPDSGRFNHTLIVSRIIPGINPVILVCAHTNDARNRPLFTYNYSDIRFLHIAGVRT